MPDVDGAVVVGVPAADTEACVGRVRRNRQRDRRIVDAVAHHACTALGDGSREGVVGGDHERRRHLQASDQRAPACRDELELAVAIELVAEEVAERDRARRQLIGDGGQRGLVTFEQAELGRRGLADRERRGDAGGEIGTGAVAGQVHAPPQHLGEQAARGRLAVGGGDDDAAAREALGKPSWCVRRERGQHPARQRRAAAAAGCPRSERRCPSGGECQPQHRRSPSTRSSLCPGTARVPTPASLVRVATRILARDLHEVRYARQGR